MTNQPSDCSRRAVVGALGLAMISPMLAAWTRSRALPWGTPRGDLKPGDYIWAPERAPDGEIITIVSIPEQRVFVYRGGVEMAVSTCSTGRKGHRTPTGVFSVLQKDKDHVSSTYKGAQMPFMERLTWSGIALHAGNLPGYPASHGCIRLPYEFAGKLFGISHLGMVVILADSHAEPAEVVHPGLFLPAAAEREARALVEKTVRKKAPPKARHEAPHRPAKILISVADRTVTVFEDGHIRAQGPANVAQPDVPIGNHTFVLQRAHESGTAFVWTSVAYHNRPGRGRPAASDAAVLNRITTDAETAHAIETLMHPGLLMVVTDAPAPNDTRSNRSFVIAAHYEPEGWKQRAFGEN